MRMLAVLAVVVLLSTFAAKSFGDFNATTGAYFCNAKDLKVEESGYSYFVYQENRYWSGERPEDIAATLLKTDYSSNMLNNLGKAYHCLSDNGIDPDSVARIPPELLQGLDMAKQQDPEKFSQIASDFDRYVPVPEFGPATAVIAAALVMALLVSKRFT